MSPLLVFPRALTKPLRWPADSVRRARHNAFAANAALAVRRAEREEVDQFLADRRRTGHRSAGSTLAAAEQEVHLPHPRSTR
jgi:hypothetical protein